MERDDANGGPVHGGITRRKLIAQGSQAALALAGASWLGSESLAAAATKPVRGGTFTVGMLTAGPAETVNPAASVNLSDLLRIAQLYDLLFTISPDNKK